VELIVLNELCYTALLVVVVADHHSRTAPTAIRITAYISVNKNSLLNQLAACHI